MSKYQSYVQTSNTNNLIESQKTTPQQPQYCEKCEQRFQVIENNLKQIVQSLQTALKSLQEKNQSLEMKMIDKMIGFQRQFDQQNQMIQSLQLSLKERSSISSNKLEMTNLSNNSNNSNESELNCRQCKKVIEKQQLEDIITNAIKNNRTARCDYCKNALSDKDVRQIGHIGDQYIYIKNEKNLRFIYEKIKQNSPQNLVRCSNRMCNFFCFWNSNLYATNPQSMYFCPSCLVNNIKPQILKNFTQFETDTKSDKKK